VRRAVRVVRVVPLEHAARRRRANDRGQAPVGGRWRPRELALRGKRAIQIVELLLKELRAGDQLLGAGAQHVERTQSLLTELKRHDDAAQIVDERRVAEQRRRRRRRLHDVGCALHVGIRDALLVFASHCGVEHQHQAADVCDADALNGAMRSVEQARALLAIIVAVADGQQIRGVDQAVGNNRCLDPRVVARQLLHVAHLVDVTHSMPSLLLLVNVEALHH
jgi:hypothetical protein